MYFWKNKWIPKELQQHITKTIMKVRSNNMPTLAKEEVREFLEKSENIISSSIENKDKK